MPFNYPWSLLLIVWLLLVPINITGIKGNQTVLEGDNLLLICEASSQLKPNITWTKEKPVVVQEGKVLNIINISRTYAGEYNCSADNGFGKPEIRTVYVNVTCEYVLKKTRSYTKMHFPYIFCVVMYCAVNYFYWCLARYIHAGLQAQFFKKSFNCEMVAIEHKNSHWREHIFMLHYIFGEPDDMIATLSFANLVCSLLCWFKDCNNGQRVSMKKLRCLKAEAIYHEVAETYM